ncbi:MAG: EAL domain-containing protein [Pseudomonadota bacterium]
MLDSSVIESLPDIFLELDSRAKITRYYGGGKDDPLLIPEDLVGKKVAEIWPLDIAKLTLRKVRRALTDRTDCKFDIRLTKGEQSQFYEVRLLVRGFNRVLTILRPIAEPSRSKIPDIAADRLAVDTLTGLAKREVFLAQLEYMLSDASLRGRGLATVCVDIDGFSKLNKSLGRDVGDAVLREATKRIKEQLRGSDSFTRLGSDEFMLVIADVETRDHINHVSDRVRTAFGDPFEYQGHSIQVTPSIGIALYPGDGKEPDTLVENARMALNEARMHGDSVSEFYSPTMRFRALKRFDDRSELQWAVEREQLRLRYQPRVNIETGQIDGMEALLRWQHPIRGELTPDQFLTLAEASGSMPNIGNWVINTACADASEWAIQGHQLPVSVNLSQSEFAHSGLLDVVRQALTTLPGPGILELEIAESMLMKNERAYNITQKLKELGVSLVVDDFGAGFSSPSRLIRFPIDAIKIGGELMQGVADASQSQSVCSALIAMSRELGLNVIGVGVETSGQLDFLKAKGCKSIQGLLLSEPLKSDQVFEFLDDYDPKAFNAADILSHNAA